MDRDLRRQVRQAAKHIRREHWDLATRKVEWTPIRLRALWIENLYELQASVLAGWLWQKPQPDWGAGEQRRARNDKYQARLGAAGPWTVASFEWGDIG